MDDIPLFAKQCTAELRRILESYSIPLGGELDLERPLSAQLRDRGIGRYYIDRAVNALGLTYGVDLEDPRKADLLLRQLFSTIYENTPWN